MPLCIVDSTHAQVVFVVLCYAVVAVTISDPASISKDGQIDGCDNSHGLCSELGRASIIEYFFGIFELGFALEQQRDYFLDVTRTYVERISLLTAYSLFVSAVVLRVLTLAFTDEVHLAMRHDCLQGYQVVMAFIAAERSVELLPFIGRIHRRFGLVRRSDPNHCVCA